MALKTRARGAFIVVLSLQGGWWVWATILVTDFHRSNPTFDWVDTGFGKGFALFLFWVIGFQLNYMYLYFVVGNLATSEAEVVRIAGLLRGTESAAQAVSYGLNAIPIMGSIGSVYLNFGLWAVAIFPAWLVIKEIGVTIGGDRKASETGEVGQKEQSVDPAHSESGGKGEEKKSVE